MINQSLLERKISETRELLEFLESLRDQPSPKTSNDDLGQRLWRLVHGRRWPLAIDPSRICHPYDDNEKIRRGLAAIDQLVDRQLNWNCSFLDFGCGEGHTAYAATQEGVRISVGYDLKPQGWVRFPRSESLIFTDNYDVVRSHGTYDIILLYDVLDHVSDDTVDLLKSVVALMSMGGRCYIRCHPFTAPHGGHTHPQCNKAFAHLILDQDSIRRMGAKMPSTRPIHNVLTTYRKWFEAAGLKIIRERPRTRPIDPFFDAPKLKAMLEPYGDDLTIEFVDYILSREPE